MINAIYIFNLEKDILITKEYTGPLEIKTIIEKILKNTEVNFLEFGEKTVVYKKFDGFFVAFIVENEDEMYTLSILNLMMSAMDKLLGSLNQKSFIYHFKDVLFAIDNFILNGKVTCLDPLEISTSPHHLKPINWSETK